MTGPAASHVAVYVLLHTVVLAQAQKIVLFGDSLSDSGYGAKRIEKVLGTNAVYPAAPYWKGRYSDGSTWVELAATALGVELENYACGGATSGAAPATNVPIVPPFGGLKQPFLYQAPNFGEQVELYFADSANKSNAEDVYVVEFGSNDLLQILFGFNATVEEITTDIREGIETLFESGARKFVVCANVRVFAPGFTEEAALHASQVLSLGLFTELTALVAELPLLFPGSSAELYDFGGALVEIYGSATLLGITNTTACYEPEQTTLAGRSFADAGAQSGSLCSDPTAHAFFDTFHPTSTVHRGISRAFLRDIAPAFWEAAAANASAVGG